MHRNFQNRTDTALYILIEKSGLKTIHSLLNYHPESPIQGVEILDFTSKGKGEEDLKFEISHVNRRLRQETKKVLQMQKPKM